MSCPYVLDICGWADTPLEDLHGNLKDGADSGDVTQKFERIARFLKLLTLKLTAVLKNKSREEAEINNRWSENNDRTGGVAADSPMYDRRRDTRDQSSSSIGLYIVSVLRVNGESV